MLGLIRTHVIIDYDFEYTCTRRNVRLENEWEIGEFETFKDIENYLVKYHNYEFFDNRDKELILLALGECGLCNLPVYRNEYLDDGVTQIRFMVIRK